MYKIYVAALYGIQSVIVVQLIYHICTMYTVHSCTLDLTDLTALSIDMTDIMYSIH